jgi:hypothetical protein
MPTGRMNPHFRVDDDHREILIQPVLFRDLLNQVGYSDPGQARCTLCVAQPSKRSATLIHVAVHTIASLAANI